MTQSDPSRQSGQLRSNRRFALRLSFAYAGFATAWILASDRVLEWLAPDAATMSRMQTFKGWFFVLLTATLLYFFIGRRGDVQAAAQTEPSDDRRLKWTIIAAALAILVVTMLNLVYSLWEDRRDLVIEAERTTQNLAQVIEEQTAGQFNMLDLKLTSVSRALGFLPEGTPQRNEKIQTILRQDLRTMPFVRAIYVTDASGNMIHDTDSFPAQKINFSDREYFRAQRDDPALGLYVGAPILSRTKNIWFISVSRRLSAPDGRFAGVIAAAIEPAYMHHFFESIKVGSEGSVALFRRDGALLARAPMVEGTLGKNFSSIQLMATELPRAEVGTFQTTSTLDGVPRVLSYRAVKDRPLVVLVGLSRNEVLANWRGRAWTYGLVSFAFMLFIAWLGGLVMRELGRRAALNAVLQTSEARFSSAFHASPVAQSIADIESARFIDVNDRFAEMFGYRREELLGRSAVDLGIWGDPSRRAEMVERLNRDGGVRDFTAQNVCKDGSLKDVQMSVVTTRFGDNEQPVLIAILNDITDRLRAERALIESARLNRTVLNALEDVIVVRDRDSVIQIANPSAAKLYGMPVEEMIGRADLASSVRYFREDGTAQTREMSSHFLALQDGIARYGMVLRIVRADGSESWVESNAIPLFREGEDSPYAVVSKFTDITERKKAGEEIARLHADLERRVAERTADLETANQELESFGYSVSHDLRAPLRHMDGFARMAAERLKDADETTRRYLDVITRSAAKMGLLIDGLLNLSRTGRAQLRLGEVDLGVLVREVRDELMQDAGGRDISWEIGDLPRVKGDPAMLRQVFVNLLGNAVKFTGRRDAARIEINALAAGPGEVCVCVRDNGAGFDMQYVDKLFGVFQRLHRDDDFEGTGIGLATVQRIIERHGGRVRVEAELDHGAAFYVTLQRF